jgi:hypothetical protein
MQRSAGRGAWARTEFAATLVVALILFSGGCKSRPKGANAGEIISVDLPLGSYVRPHAVGSTGDPTKFFFPTLEIYDDAGALICSSHESVENARVLQGLPASIRMGNSLFWIFRNHAAAFARGRDDKGVSGRGVEI